MAEFIEVMRQARRLCDAQRNCSRCPLRSEEGTYCGGIDTLRDRDDATTEKTVLAWAAAHPEAVYPSWAEYQDEMFPDHTRKICPMMFGVECLSCNAVCEDCRNKPMPAEIAEKLGVRPREA